MSDLVESYLEHQFEEYLDLQIQLFFYIFFIFDVEVLAEILIESYLKS